MSTITQLQAEINELEKRIKAISTAQSSLTQLMAIGEYFEQVQKYLVELNSAYNNHTIQSEEFSTQILNLQQQVNEISERVDNISLGGDYNLEEMQANISTILQDLETLKGNSQTTLEQIDESLESLQTDHQNMQDDININTTNISTNMQDIANLKTSVTNITATQNSLTTSQSNLNSSVTNINSRLTKVEANVDTLTGGVDVAYLDERISNLEAINGQIVAFENYNYGFTPNNVFYTRYYYYLVPYNTNIHHVFDLDYLCESKMGTMTASIYVNDVLEYTKIIDLSNFSNGYKFDFPFKNKYKTNKLKLKFSSTSNVLFNSMTMILTGNNISIIKYDYDLSVNVFNGYIYITKHLPNGIKFGKFLPSDTIDLDNLPNELVNYDNEYCYSYMCYIPFPNGNFTSENYFTFDDAIIKETNDNYKVIDYYPKQSTRPSTNLYTSSKSSGNMCIGYYSKMLIICVDKDKPVYNKLDFESPLTDFPYLNQKIQKCCTYATHIDCNYKYFEDKILEECTDLIAKYDDGNIYYCDATYKNVYYVPIQQGDCATAYRQPNGEINVYVCKNNSINKYKLIKNELSQYESHFVTTLTNCDVVYETLDNQIIKHTSNGWRVDTLVY